MTLATNLFHLARSEISDPFELAKQESEYTELLNLKYHSNCRELSEDDDRQRDYLDVTFFLKLVGF